MRTLAAFAALAGLTLIISCGAQRNNGPSAITRVYVTNEASGELSVIDGSNNTVITTVRIGKRPRGIQISPDRKTILVALSGSPFAGPGVDPETLPPPDKSADGIGVLDVETNQLRKVLAAGSDPEQFAITKDGQTIYVANEDVALTTVLDVASGNIIKTVPVGEEPEGVEISPDGTVVYVTSESNNTVSAISTATNEIVATVKVGPRPRAIAFLPNGERAYVSAENDGSVAVIDAKKHILLETIRFPGEGVKPMGVVVSPDGKRLYVTTGRFRRLFAIDTVSNEIVGSLEVGERPWGVAITPDGKTIYTANGPSNDVTVVDVANYSIIAKIKVSDRPWGVAVLQRN